MIMNLESAIKLSLVLLFSVQLTSCQSHSSDTIPVDRDGLQSVIMHSDLVIGAEDQPFENQFGRPIAVRTDNENNIYVADRASKIIEVFDRDGNHIRNLGGRGRGPGEYQEMEFMELTPEGHLVVMDRGNLLYTVVTTQGEFVESFRYNWDNQFFPTQIYYTGSQMLALFLDANRRSEIPRVERDLFHIYSVDFQEPIDSFFPFNRLEVGEGFTWLETMRYPGSFAVVPSHTQMIYSPVIYKGLLYVFNRLEDGRWAFENTIGGLNPQVNPYEIINSSEEEFESIRHLPGISRIYSDKLYMGRLLSFDAGIFHLNDGGLIHFWGERRENELFDYEPGMDYHYLSIYAQVFNEQGEVIWYDELLTIKERHPSRYRYKLVNWKDNEDNFYLMEQSMDEVPVVRRFTVELEGR
jgi:hypothetical protein